MSDGEDVGTRLSRRDVRSAQMLIKSRLRWVEGYPFHRGSEWITLRGRTIELTPSLLRGSTRALGELVERYPHALTEIFQDADGWVVSVQGVLDLLKTHVHQGESLPRNLFAESDLHTDAAEEKARRIAARTPELKPAIEVLSWTLATSQDSVRPVLDWLATKPEAATNLIEHQEPEWASIAVARLGRLVSLDGARLLAPIEDLYGYSLLHTLAPPSTFQRLTGLLMWAVQFSRAERRRLYRLVEQIGFQDMLTALSHDDTRDTQDALSPLETLGLIADALVQCVWLSERPGLYQPFMSVFRQLPRTPERAAWPMYLLLRWVGLARLGRSYGLDSSVEAVTTCLGRHLKTWTDPGEFLRPWAEAAVESNARFDWLLMMASEVDPEPFFDAVSTLKEEADRDRSQAATPPDLTDRRVLAMLAQLSLSTADPEILAQLIRYWVVNGSESNPYVDTDIVRVSLAFTVRGYDAFWPVYQLMEDRFGERRSLEALEALVRFDDGRLVDFISPLLTSHDFDTVLDAGLMLRVLTSLGVEEVPDPPEAADATPAWAARFPTEFGPALALLSSSAPNAERLADRILRKNYPKKGSMLTEINALRSRISAAPEARRQKMQRRIENLERRVDSLPPVSSVTKANLQAKLQRAASRAMLQAWMDDLLDAFRTAAAARFGLLPETEWLTGQRFVALAPHLIFSEPSLASLVATILGAREGRFPWKLRDHPANERFVNRMVELGVGMDPWLNGIDPLATTDDQGRQVLTGFEDDPLEIFNMGKPFGTCLSPGEPYFSSVLANAADINKRVVIARYRDGSVVGRCLIALTDDGDVLSFHPYCNDPDLDFRSIVWDFVGDLCSRMGTKYRPYSYRYRSEVSTLVGARWLDDGPVDISGVFDETSTLRRALTEVPPPQVTALLESELEEFGVLDLYLPSILRLPEVAARPELVVALFPELRRAAPTLPMTAVADGAVLLEAAGRVELATQLLIPRSRDLRHTSRAETIRFLEHPAARLVAEHDPSTLLRILRTTRHEVYTGKRVTEWEEEFPTRAALAAIALEALNRRAQAQEVWRSIANQKPIGLPDHLLNQLHAEAEHNLARLSRSIE